MKLYKIFFLIGVLMFMADDVNADCPKSLDFDIKLLGEEKAVNLCENYLG